MPGPRSRAPVPYEARFIPVGFLGAVAVVSRTYRARVIVCEWGFYRYVDPAGERVRPVHIGAWGTAEIEERGGGET